MSWVDPALEPSAQTWPGLWLESVDVDGNVEWWLEVLVLDTKHLLVADALSLNLDWCSKVARLLGGASLGRLTSLPDAGWTLGVDNLWLLDSQLLGSWVPFSRAAKNSEGVDNTLQWFQVLVMSSKGKRSDACKTYRKSGPSNEVELSCSHSGRDAVKIPIELEP